METRTKFKTFIRDCILYNINEEVRRVKEDELVTFKADFTTFSHFA